MKLAPITFDPVENAYHVIGEKVGNAFCDGAKLKWFFESGIMCQYMRFHRHYIRKGVFIMERSVENTGIAIGLTTFLP